MLILPLSTFGRFEADFNAQDTQTEIEQLFARQAAIDGLLSGKVTPDVVLDLLESQGIDPVEYVDHTVVNIETAIARGYLPDDFDQVP